MNFQMNEIESKEIKRNNNTDQEEITTKVPPNNNKGTNKNHWLKSRTIGW